MTPMSRVLEKAMGTNKRVSTLLIDVYGNPISAPSTRPFMAVTITIPYDNLDGTGAFIKRFFDEGNHGYLPVKTPITYVRLPEQYHSEVNHHVSLYVDVHDEDKRNITYLSKIGERGLEYAVKREFDFVQSTSERYWRKIKRCLINHFSLAIGIGIFDLIVFLLPSSLVLTLFVLFASIISVLLTASNMNLKLLDIRQELAEMMDPKRSSFTEVVNGKVEYRDESTIK